MSRLRVLAALGVAVVVGLVVMGVVTAVRHDDGRSPQPFAADLAGNGVLAVVSLGPGAVGENEVHIFLTPPGGSIVPVLDATVVLTSGGTAIDATLVRESANHYSGTIDFPSSGDWDLDLRVQIDDTSSADLHTVVPVP